jgi:hypothetical protein
MLWRNLDYSGGFVVSRLKTGKTPRGSPVYYTRHLIDGQVISVNPSALPIILSPDTAARGKSLFGYETIPHANLSKRAREYLAQLGTEDPDADAKAAGLIWMHALAIAYSEAYLSENSDGIRRDWPRIPLPVRRKVLESSAALGEQIAALLDTEVEIRGVTCGEITPVFKTIGQIAKAGGGQLDAAGDDLAVTAGWGHFGKKGRVQPAKGKLVVREYDQDEAKAMNAEATARGLSAKDARRLFGETTCDVYLNGAAYWRNIPVNVWEYYIGGYQIIRKWLSYREVEILGRPLKPEEAREVMNSARRIAAIILLQPKLDENYRKVKAAALDWSTT